MTLIAQEKRPGNSLGEFVPDGWHMTEQAANLCGVSRDTVRRWRNKKIYGPSGYMVVGETEMKVWLYSDLDIANMKALNLRPGRKSVTRDQTPAA